MYLYKQREREENIGSETVCCPDHVDQMSAFDWQLFNKARVFFTFTLSKSSVTVSRRC